MIQITAAQVRELRERTGAGMMECKRALEETQGDMETAIEWLRKSGLAKAVKRAGRIAAEGIIVIALEGRRAAMVEVNSETDFVAKGDDFRAFAEGVARRALKSAPADLDALMGLPLEDGGNLTVADRRQELAARIGENIGVRRFAFMETDGVLGSYRHGTPARIGVLVDMKGGDEALAKDIAMHIAASRPLCINADQVPQDLLAKEKEIYAAQAAESGKPPQVIEKMVEGRLKKFIAAVTLLGQPFVKNPELSVGKLLSDAGAEVKRFERFEVGEGIEKKGGDFAAEVMAQVKGH
jgi:elongation factor Ts